MMLYRLTVLDGIVDVTNDTEMAQCNITLFRRGVRIYYQNASIQNKWYLKENACILYLGGLP